VDDDVYDLTKFQEEHPGGQKSEVSNPGHSIDTDRSSLLVLTRVAGKDASKQFWKYHNEGILKKYKGQLQVGSLDSKTGPAAPPTPPATPSPAEIETKTETVKPQAESGTVAPVPGKDAEEAKESMDPFGAMIPYADPSWYQSVRPPFSTLPKCCDLRPFSSIIRHISMRLTLLSVPKFVNG